MMTPSTGSTLRLGEQRKIRGAQHGGAVALSDDEKRRLAIALGTTPEEDFDARLELQILGVIRKEEPPVEALAEQIGVSESPAGSQGTEAQLRVAVIAGVRIYREGLARFLEHQSGLEVVATAADVNDALPVLARMQPTIALVDVTAGPGAVKRLREVLPALKVVALAVAETDQDVIGCAEAGVSGYVTSDDSLEAVAAIVSSVARGEMLCAPRVAAALLRRVASGTDTPATPGSDRLTMRELEIIRLIDEGLSNKQIASRLSIALPTVKNHVHNILEKLHVNRRAEAAADMRRRRSAQAVGTVLKD